MSGGLTGNLGFFSFFVLFSQVFCLEISKIIKVGKKGVRCSCKNRVGFPQVILRNLLGTSKGLVPLGEGHPRGAQTMIKGGKVSCPYP